MIREGNPPVALYNLRRIGAGASRRHGRSIGKPREMPMQNVAVAAVLVEIADRLVP